MATCSLPDVPCSGGRPPCPRPSAGGAALPSWWPATIPAYKGGEMDKDPAELWVQMALVPRALAQPNPGSLPTLTPTPCGAVTLGARSPSGGLSRALWVWSSLPGPTPSMPRAPSVTATDMPRHCHVSPGDRISQLRAVADLSLFGAEGG